MDAPGTEVVAQAEHAAATWDVLAGQVQAFIQAWEGRPEPPDVAEFVTDGPTNIRRLVLFEIIKVDLDYRWSRGRQPRPVEDYLAAFPELAVGRAALRPALRGIPRPQARRRPGRSAETT